MLFVRMWIVSIVLALTLESMFGQIPSRPAFSQTSYPYNPPNKFSRIQSGNNHPLWSQTTPSPNNSSFPPIVKPPTTGGKEEIRQEECPPPHTVLNFSRTGLRKLGDAFVQSPDTLALYLDDNDIVEISSMAFASMTKLQVLSICRNNISTGKLLWFAQHETLLKLILNENKYNASLSIDKIFQSLPRLRELSLRRNRITALNIELKNFAPNLIRLDLSGNEITSTSFLATLPKTLIDLCLDDNAISKVAEGVLATVEKLSVTGNNIEELCGGNCDADASLPLKGIVNLSKLNASRNKIEKVSADAFADTARLTVLDLSANRLTSLPNDVFHRLSSLLELRLSRNKISSVLNVCSLQRLTYLDLSDNLIEAITDQSFACTSLYIKTLLLVNNHIVSVSDAALLRLQTLETLDLSGNAISELPIGFMRGTRYLQVLLLKDNKIMNIDALFALNNQISFKMLHLEGNPFHIIKTGTLPHLTIHVKDLRSTNKNENCTAKADSDKKKNSSDETEENTVPYDPWE